jgi:hypothetical protein
MEREVKKLKARPAVGPDGRAHARKFWHQKPGRETRQAGAISRGREGRNQPADTSSPSFSRHPPVPPQLKLASLTRWSTRPSACCSRNWTTAAERQDEAGASIALSPIDPTQIQQVLVNLIKNAMQAMTREAHSRSRRAKAARASG